MLNVQTYLKDGKTLDDLKAELGVNHTAHPTLPLVVLNYDQIESPKTHPVVRECRGLVLHSQTFDLVARSFPRFFNWGEVADEMPLFDFSDFIVHSKEDGSLCVLYHFDGQWHGNTRGSFGLDNMQNASHSWRDAFLIAMNAPSWDSLDTVLDSDLVYVCEFVSPWNKVVRAYHEPKMYLLTAFQGHHELPWEEVDHLPGPFLRPDRYHCRTIGEVMAFLKEQESADPTFEGVVLRDRHNRRWKIKNPTYLALHRMRGEGDNLYNPKNLIPFILANEGDELLTYFPEVASTYADMKATVDTAYAALEQTWAATKDIDGQKDFALAIAGKTPFTGILFNLRKRHGHGQTVELLKQHWRESGDTILNTLFKTKN